MLPPGAGSAGGIDLIRYIRTRLFTVIPVFFGITLLVFLFLDLGPGTIADLMGEGGGSVDADRAAVEARLGLDQPLPVRYARWLGGLLRGDLGKSYQTGRPVADTIAQRVMPSIILTGTGVVLAVALAVPLGVLAAWKPRSGWDRLATLSSMVSAGVPGFLLSLMAVYLFSVGLGLLPSSRMYTTGSSGTLPDLLRHLILPAGVICVSNMGSLVKQTRSACLEVLGEDYMRTAWAKGLKDRAVMTRHMLRGALIPILTTILSHIPHIIGGSVVVETVFAWPGIGSLIVNAAKTRDFQMLQYGILIIAAAVTLTNTMVDLSYAFLDPRIRDNF